MLDRLRYSMQALQILSRSQEVTANNLANLNTAGFKKDKLFFRSFQEQINGQSMRSVEAQQVLNLEPGEMKKTGNPFDLAIEGDGFFQVQKNGQKFLTRSGRFRLDSEGFLRDENDGYVQGTSGNIYIPQFEQMNSGNQQMNIEIAKDGAVRVNDELVDQVKLMKVDNLQNLERRTNSYLALKDGASAQRDTESMVNQGYFETGNINPLEQMTDMVTNMRLFESQQRAMTTTDEILQQVSTKLGRF